MFSFSAIMSDDYTFINLEVKPAYIIMQKQSPEANTEKGLELRRLRKEAGWTQIELAQMLDVSRVTIINWESGKWPEPIVERGLAATLGKSPLYFDNHIRRLSGEPEQPIIESEKPAILTQLEILMEANPQHTINGAFTIEDVQQILKSQIEAFFKLAMPDGKVTAPGMQRLNSLLQQDLQQADGQILDGHAPKP